MYFVMVNLNVKGNFFSDHTNILQNYLPAIFSDKEHILEHSRNCHRTFLFYRYLSLY